MATRLGRFIRKIFRRPIPELPADATFEERETLARSISEEQIYLETVKNAINADGASLTDKLMFALTSLPPQENFEDTKIFFYEILEKLLEDGDITPEEKEELIQAVKPLRSLEDIGLAETFVVDSTR